MFSRRTFNEATLLSRALTCSFQIPLVFFLLGPLAFVLKALQLACLCLQFQALVNLGLMFVVIGAEAASHDWDEMTHC